MTMLDSEMGWFEIFKVTCFGDDEVAAVNDEQIDKSSAMVSLIFNNI